MEFIFEKMSEKHEISVMDIFNYYVENSFAAYPEEHLPYETYNLFLNMTRGYPAYVLKENDNDKVIGFCFLRAYNPLPAFKETAEVTYFFDPETTGKGIGKKALEKLEKEGKEMGIKHILANVSSKNENSIRFHLKNGFYESGRFKNVAVKNSETFDVVWLQKDL
ncbi:MAG: N-acetyltransferase [Ignavibacteriae bacterium]|nr:N-acetyltransferase [Ignavibacteriota bacterium]